MTLPTALSHGRMTLRPATHTDAEAIAAYQQLPQVHEYISRLILTVDDALALIKERSEEPTSVLYVIEVVGRVAGTIGGRFFRPETMGPEPEVWDFYLGYVLDPAVWGQGIATAAVALFVAALHEESDVRRVTAKVFAENIGSVKVLQKNGFTLEGTERAAVLARDGRWLDDCTLSHFAAAGCSSSLATACRTR